MKVQSNKLTDKLGTQRLQKYMARAGIASRRASEKIIEQGRVKVDGQTITTLGFKVDPKRAKVSVDGKIISDKTPNLVYIMVNKPAYVLSTAKDDRERKTVLDLVQLNTRLFPVGRLDYMSEGLILLTNDGPLAQKLTHPSFGHEREYKVLLSKAPTRDVLRQWRAGGFMVEGKAVRPMKVEPAPDLGANWITVVLNEGRKRQIEPLPKT